MTYTPERFTAETASWKAAAAALLRGDPDAVADEFAPPLSDEETYTRAVTMAIVGALLCGEQVARLDGYMFGKPPHYGFWELRPLTPNAWKNPNGTCAAQTVTAAANGDFHMVCDLVLAHMRAHDPIEATGLLVELLGIYVDLARAEPVEDNQRRCP